MKYFQQQQKTHSSQAHMELNKTEQIWGHKTHINKFKRIDIIL